jgi:hypothetical protein
VHDALSRPAFREPMAEPRYRNAEEAERYQPALGRSDRSRSLLAFMGALARADARRAAKTEAYEAEETTAPAQGGREMARIGQILSDEELYLRLRQVIEDMPDLRSGEISPEIAKWLGEASFLVEECGYIPDTTEFRTQLSSIGTMMSRAHEMIPTILYRALARTQAKAPSAAHGTFIAAGKPFDALAAISKLLSEARSDVLVVDAYAEANLLDTFLRAVPEQVPVRVLADAKGA